MRSTRNLVVLLGDQLNRRSAAFDDFDSSKDKLWMAEVSGEATFVFSHKVRVAYFLSAMRHFAEEVRQAKLPLEYRRLDADDNRGEFVAELELALQTLKPQRVVIVEPGEYRVEEFIKAVAHKHSTDLDIRPDRDFYCSREEFRSWSKQHPHLRMEFFYREMRRKTGVLMEAREPVGGKWNFDAENRKSFGKNGPGILLSPPESFPPDKITRDVIALVNRRFAKHPGTLDRFDLPITSKDARKALDDFIAHRLPAFGNYQDAMWTGEPYLYHSRLSAAMNLKLLDAKTVVMAAEDAYQRGNVPLAAAEGFIRQIIGWREYVRGIYWTFMPEYAARNALAAQEKLPDFYWDGNTDMHCLRQVIGQTLDHGYAHHIQRLMITGLFALLFGTDPVEVHKWYLAIYWDAVEWVELPNTIGMSQFADGGLMGSKPYVASGKYINRMSNYCRDCRYKPDEATGKTACPFTNLYWDFLLRHEKLLQRNQRMSLQLKNLIPLSAAKKQAIRKQAEVFRREMPKGSY